MEARVKAAQLVADLLAQGIGPQGGEIAFIRFHQGSQTDTQREQGFLDGLKKHPELKLVATQSSQSDATVALAVTENILTAHPNLKGIFAANESGVIGAVEALRRAGKARNIDSPQVHPILFPRCGDPVSEGRVNP